MRLNGQTIYLALYVDDTLIIASSAEILTYVKKVLSSEFKMTDLGSLSFFLGVQAQINKLGRCIALHQKHYIEKLTTKFKMDDAKTADTPAVPGMILSKEHSPKTEEEEKQMSEIPYRMLVGCLLWISNWTRPDIAHATSTVSQFLVNPGQMHRIAAKRILRYLKGTMNLGLQYLSEPGALKILCWTDSDWAADRDTRRSISVYSISVGKGMVTCSSKKQNTIALSSTEAEYAAVTAAAQEVLHIRSLLKSIGLEQIVATVVFCDNQAAIALTKNPIMHARTRHVEVKMHFIRKSVEDKAIEMHYVPTSQNTAHILTKALPKLKLRQHVGGLGLIELS